MREILFHRLPLNIRSFHFRGINIMLNPRQASDFVIILIPLGWNGRIFNERVLYYHCTAEIENLL